MYLVIAEKPSVSRSIAHVIGAEKNQEGYLEGKDCIVSWCLGHLAEYFPPDAYDEKFRRWNYDDLPIIPKDGNWKYRKRKGAALRFKKALKPPGYPVCRECL